MKGKCGRAQGWGLRAQHRLEKAGAEEAVVRKQQSMWPRRRWLASGPLTTNIDPCLACLHSYLASVAFRISWYFPNFAWRPAKPAHPINFPWTKRFFGLLLTEMCTMRPNDVSLLAAPADLLYYSAPSLLIKSSLNPHFTSEVSGSGTLQWAELQWGGSEAPWINALHVGHLGPSASLCSIWSLGTEDQATDGRWARPVKLTWRNWNFFSLWTLLVMLNS